MDARRAFDSLARMSGNLEGMDGILREHLKYVKGTWEGIEAVLADAEELEIRDKLVQLWLRDLRDLVYEIEDLLDLCGYQIKALQGDDKEMVEEEEEFALSTVATSTCAPKRKFEEFGKDITDRALNIRIRFNEIAERKSALSLSSNSNTDGSKVYERIPSTHCPPRNSTFVGRKAEKENLLKMLLDDGGSGVDPFQVIGVVGMGGVGKTALCQQIFNDSKITERFPVRAWVYFGDSCSLQHPVEELTGRILEWFLEKTIESSQLSFLQQKLIQYLRKEENRFLLVLDDVWYNNIDIWESVLAPFRDSKRGSKILVTTCNEEVIRCIANSKVIRLPCLLEEEAQELLRKYASIRDEDRARDEETISLKCGGLPLAIKNIGNHLGRSNEGWNTILDNDLWNCGLWEEGREIFGPLYLSYLKLPSHLKACFKFCSLLEKDKEYYGTRTLTEMWTAHALMKKEKGTLDSVGKSFIDMLVRRSFLEHTHDYGKIRVQNIILDFARYVSGSEFCIMHQHEQPKSFADVQHLVINPVKDRNRDQNANGGARPLCSSARPLRTLIFNADGLEWDAGCLDSRMKRLRFLKIGPAGMLDWQKRLPDLKLLRVLSIEIDIADVPESLYDLYGLIKLYLSSTKIRNISEKIGNLKNLRVIDLHDTNIQKIPDSICRLSDLEELILPRCKDILRLPDGISELLSLRLLYDRNFCSVHAS